MVPRHPGGFGSSHQLVVGCGPGEGAEGEGGNLWKIIDDSEKEVRIIFGRSLQLHICQELHNPEEPVVIRNNSRVSLNSWSRGRREVQLNSHNVAAPLSRTQQEVSGYINYNIGMEPDVSGRLKHTELV